jgi:cobalt-precorrin 5A hydrolase/precorrin-3B C17-methyltransferase
MSGPVFLCLTEGGAALARRLALPGAAVHGLKGRVGAADVLFASTSEHLRALFANGTPIVGVCAAGALIRILAPLLNDKQSEPPVLALAEDGSAVVPLIGGHRGANELARRIAKVLNIAPAITTAGDLSFGVALDDPPAGWRLANPQDYKGFAAALLSGARVRMQGQAPWLESSKLPFAADAELTITVSERNSEQGPNALVYQPATLCLGVGCERGAEPQELIALARETLADAGLAAESVALVASLDLKADEAAVHALADELGVPARFFTAARLEQETPRLANPSDLVFREVGCYGVAEGAALAAAGPEGELVAAKRKSARATCAIARAPQPIDAQSVGQARGSLAVVGLGPGDPAWRAPEADAVLHDAQDLVGYTLYLDLLGPLANGKTRHDFPLGAEEARVRAALDLAAWGRRVALVCSGDPGIYAMASLVFELLEREGRAEWRRCEIAVVPGISALQAAAARAGAPLGHDFCAISLSDLLTPWPAIERRLRAAAEGDFVVALYNPVSQRRTRQLARAREILSAHRSAETPVIIARNLGRDGERVEVLTLEDLEAGKVDMLSVVLIGSSETRRVARGDGGAWVYTPRGYAGKAAKSSEDAA